MGTFGTHSGEVASSPATSDAETDRSPVLRELRSSALQGLLVVSAIVASVAYVPGAYAAWSRGLHGVVVIDTVMWMAVIVLALCRGLGYVRRSVAFCTLWLLFSVALLWILGPVGAGVAWLLALPVLTTLFFGVRGAVIGLTAIVVVGASFGVALAGASAGLGAMAGLGGPAYDGLSWAASIGSVAFLGVLLAVAVHLLLRGLERALVAERRANDALRETLAERSRLQAAAVEGAKAQALGNLASGVAHDLNNLLVPMLVAGAEAREAAEPGTPQRRRLDLVLASAERARALAGRVLAFIRNVPEARHPLALAPLVQEVAALLRSGSAATTSVVVHVAPEAQELHVEALPDELHSVFMNLGSNAVRAVAERGSAGVVRFHVDVRSGADGPRVVVRVRDDGPGVPERLHESLFEPYVTSRAPGDGTGLGLAIVRHLVTGLGGRVSLLATGPSGSTFEVVLPAAARSAMAPSRAHRAAEGEVQVEAPLPGRVIVVDDEPLVRATTAMTLEALGYLVTEVGSPEEALARVHDASDSVDVVVSDVAMPRMSGLDLLRAVHAVRADLPVILLSGRIDEGLAREAEEAGAWRLLAKPYERSQLADALASALRAATR